jgi:type IVB pilus formation R64 PilN family outer membrane protein
LLDLVRSRLGVNSRYTDEGVLEFYRLSTKTFQVATIPGDQTYTTQLGQTATNSGFNASSSINTNAVVRPFTAVAAAVQSMMTSAGTAVPNDLTRTIAVTDTDEALEAIAQFIEAENRLLARQIAVELTSVSFTTDRQLEYGFDWTAVYTAVLQSYGYKLSVAGPALGPIGNDGVLAVTAIPGLTADGRFNGSAAFLRALSDIGDVQVRQTHVLYTTNGRAVAYTLTKTFDYVSGTTASTTGVNAIAVGITTKTDTVGRILTILPASIGDGAIAVDVSLNESVLVSIVPQSSGEGQYKQTVQLVTKAGESSRNTIVLRPGDALVFVGVEGLENSFKRRAFGDNVPVVLGGGESGSNIMRRNFMVMRVRVTDPA